MAIFFSLFMAENCFKRVITAESRGLSGATPPTWTQGWPVQNQMLKVKTCIHGSQVPEIMPESVNDIRSLDN